MMVRHIRTLASATAAVQYRSTLTGEQIGWIVFKNEFSFAPVHQILVDPAIGPIIMIGDHVFEVDPDQVLALYLTEAAARVAAGGN